MSIGLKKQSAASVPTPPVGEQNIFIDSADDKYKKKIDTGAVVDLEAGAAGVSTFEGRPGAVVSQAGDYNAGEITNVPAGDITAINVQAAINELDTEKAPISHVGSTGSSHGLATGSVAGFMSPSDFTKLGGIASGATANDTDANLKNRANHTGTQLASTISDFATAADTQVAAGIATHVGLADPHPGYALDADVTAAQSYAVARANHTGTQTASTISDFTAAAKTAAVQDAISNGITDIAPSQNAVFDALALKSNTGHTHVVADITDYAASQALKANVAGDTFTGPVVIEGDFAGTGNVNLKSQSLLPSTPASGVALFASTDEMFSVRGQSSYSFKLNDQNLTDHRQIDIPDADGPMLLDPTTTDGDILARISGTLDRIGIGGEDFILRSIGGIPSWEEENLMQDIGDGSDGSVTLTGALTAPDNLYYTLFKPDTGGVLNPDAYIIYAKTLDLTTAQAGAITRNGNNGANTGGTTAAGAAGAAFTARVLATNGAGGAGVVGTSAAGAQGAAGGNVTIGNGGNGGASGVSGAGGNAGAAAISGGAVTTNMHFGRFEYSFIRGGTQVSGGAGGRGGNTGGGDGTNASRGSGGGGAGGAVLVLICGEIITGPSTPSGVIVAKGGNGGSNTVPQSVGNIGGTSGAGGGGGGYIYCAYVKKTGPVVTNLFDASGGNGGNGGNGFGTGTGGNGGSGGNGGRIQLFNITTGVGTLIVGSSGNLGTTASGVTGGVGGTGGSCVASL